MTRLTSWLDMMETIFLSRKTGMVASFVYLIWGGYYFYTALKGLYALSPEIGGLVIRAFLGWGIMEMAKMWVKKS